MAKHSSFKNLVALETCRNFFLIAGISPNASSPESSPEHSTALENIAPSPENSVPTDLPPPKANPIISYTE